MKECMHQIVLASDVRELTERLKRFYPVIDQRMPVIFKSEKFLDAYKILTLKNELGFNAVIADLKDGWPMTQQAQVLQQ